MQFTWKNKKRKKDMKNMKKVLSFMGQVLVV